MDQFLRGYICAGSLVVALYFYRFYRESHDRLFLFFATSFLLLGLNRGVAALQELYPIPSAVPYCVRAFAYLMILIVIVDKNRPQKESPADTGPKRYGSP